MTKSPYNPELPRKSVRKDVFRLLFGRDAFREFLAFILFMGKR